MKREMFTELVETVPLGLGVLDGDLRFIWINAYLGRLLDLPAGDQTESRRLHQCVTPASRIFLQTRLQQELGLGGAVEELALDLVADNGTRTPVMLNAAQVVTSDGDVRIQIAMSRAPIRRAYEAEVPRALREAEAERGASRAIIAAFVEHCPIPLVMTDRNLVVSGVSAAWEAAYGRKAAEIVGRRINERPGAVRPPDPMWAALYDRALAGESLTSEQPVLSAFGDRWFEWAITPWRDAADAVGGLLLMNFDVSDLIRARDEARAANEAKSQFLANMSHELRTPLNSVLAPVELLQRMPLEPAMREQIAALGRAGGALARTLTTILDFSQLATGRLEVARVPIDLRELCPSVLAAAQAETADRPIAIVAPTQIPELAVIGDPDALSRILGQLLSNAVKFTERGTVELQVAVQGDEISFTVSDTGCGFDTSEFEGLLQPFHQRDASLTRTHGGTGMGLALANALAKAVGGRLEAQGRVGEGARVTFIMPLVWGAVSARAPVPEPSAPQSPLTVLAVDDNPANLAVLGAVLGIVEADVVFASNGQEAVDQFRSRAFDLILMDVQMPVMDGLTAIRHIREHKERGGRTPIIVVSANVSRPEVAAARAAGADAVLGKPIGASALLQTIEQVVHAQAAAI